MMVLDNYNNHTFTAEASRHRRVIKGIFRCSEAFVRFLKWLLPSLAKLSDGLIQELFERFKENGVNIIGEIRQTCGPNLQFTDPDGNMWELWQP